MKFLCFAQSNYFEISEYVYLVLSQQVGQKKEKFEILVHLTLKTNSCLFSVLLHELVIFLANKIRFFFFLTTQKYFYFSTTKVPFTNTHISKKKGIQNDNDEKKMLLTYKYIQNYTYILLTLQGTTGV